MRYSKKINDSRQPLLIHHKKHRGQADETIFLIPELCFLTGMYYLSLYSILLSPFFFQPLQSFPLTENVCSSDTMRQDYQIMKAVAEHTRIAPQQRVKEINQLVHSLRDNPEIKAEMDVWGILITSVTLFIGEVNYFEFVKDMEIEPQMVQLEGTHFGSEEIFFGNGVKVNVDPTQSEWSSDCKFNSLVSL